MKLTLKLKSQQQSQDEVRLKVIVIINPNVPILNDRAFGDLLIQNEQVIRDTLSNALDIGEFVVVNKQKTNRSPKLQCLFVSEVGIPITKEKMNELITPTETVKSLLSQSTQQIVMRKKQAK